MNNLTFEQRLAIDDLLGHYKGSLDELCYVLSSLGYYLKVEELAQAYNEL